MEHCLGPMVTDAGRPDDDVRLAEKDRRIPRGDASPELRVLCLPFEPRNPYQRALADALRSRRIAVQGGAMGWRLFHRARSADVVHVHWTYALTGATVRTFALGYPRLAAHLIMLRLKGTRIVWTMHNLENHDERRRVRDWLGAALIGHCAHRVIVHGEWARRGAFRRFGITSGKVTVIPHGNYIGCYPNSISRTDARRQLGLPADAPVVLFFGNIRPYKGIEDLIEAFRTISTDAALVVAGRPVDRDTERRIGALSQQDARIRFFPGFVDDERVQVFMNAADVAVFPYREITTSGAVVLAMSFAKACIAPRIGCIPEVLDDDGAVLYDSRRPHELRRALESALTNLDRLESMGRHNRTLAEQWSWDRIAEATAEAYRGAAQ